MAVRFKLGPVRSAHCVALLLSAMGTSGYGQNAGSPAPAPVTQAGGVQEDAAEAWLYRGLQIDAAGTSSSATRRDATAAIPFDRMSPEMASKSRRLLRNVGLYRRLPSISFEADPDVYSHFLQYPDVAVATWRAMGLSKFQLKEIAPGRYSADAGDGSVGVVEVVYRTPADTLIYCEGAFKSPLLAKPIEARALMRVETQFRQGDRGQTIAAHSGDVFVEFPSQTVETVARLISPISHNIADRNFKQLTLFVQMMSTAMARHPDWVERLAERLDGVPNERRVQLCEVGSLATQRRLHLAGMGEVSGSVDELISPFRQLSAGEPVPNRR